jgi:hypothetical protein
VELGIVVISLFTHDLSYITLSALSWLELLAAWRTTQ